MLSPVAWKRGAGGGRILCPGAAPWPASGCLDPLSLLQGQTLTTGDVQLLNGGPFSIPVGPLALSDPGGSFVDFTGVFSVKKTKVSEAFPAIGHTLVFLFDYGDDWRFRVSLKETGTKQPKVRYPRVVTLRGNAPPQYPDPDEDIDDGGGTLRGQSPDR